MTLFDRRAEARERHSQLQDAQREAASLPKPAVSDSAPRNRVAYCITNDRGAVYIGQSQNFFMRMRQHRKGEGGDFTRLHGPRWRVLHSVAKLTLQEATDKEAEWTTALNNHTGLPFIDFSPTDWNREHGDHWYRAMEGKISCVERDPRVRALRDFTGGSTAPAHVLYPPLEPRPGGVSSPALLDWRAKEESIRRTLEAEARRKAIDDEKRAGMQAYYRQLRRR